MPLLMAPTHPRPLRSRVNRAIGDRYRPPGQRLVVGYSASHNHPAYSLTLSFQARSSKITMKIPLASLSSIGPEFDRLKNIQEVYINDNLLNTFKKPICRSSQKENLRNGISIKDLFFITLLWGTVSISFSIFYKLSRRLTLATCTGERLFLGLLSMAHWPL